MDTILYTGSANLKVFSNVSPDTYAVVSHLEYWCLGFLTLSLLMAVLDCAQAPLSRVTKCALDFSKPTLLLLIVCCELDFTHICMSYVKINWEEFRVALLHNVFPYHYKTL